MSYDGKRVFIWNLNRSEGGDPARIAAKAKAHGVTGVVVKHADGGHPFGAFWDEQRGRAVVEAIRAAGVDVWLWQFVYGQSGVFYGDQKLGWEAEAEQAVRALTVFGASGYMSDVEGEFENLGEQAARVALRYCQRIKDGSDKPHYWCPLAQPSYHRADVYGAFHRYVKAAFPQDYHGSMYPVGTQYYRPDRAEHAARVCHDDFQQQSFTQVPLIPAGDAIPPEMNAAHAVTPEEILTWSNTWQSLGARGALWWVWEYMTQPMWDAVHAARFEEVDEMAGTRHTSLATWFTNRVLQPGPYGPDKDATWLLRSDFGLPPEARQVELEICLGLFERNTQGFIALFDGGTPDGSNEGYAGKVTVAEGGHGTITVWLDERGACRARYSFPVLVKAIVSLRWWP